MTDPAVGAWVCASGNQVCRGKSGTFTANATAKARKIHRTADQSIGFELVEVSVMCCDSAISTRSKSSGGFRSSSALARFSSISACVAASTPPVSAASCCAWTAACSLTTASASLSAATPSWCKKARLTIPTSISAEPSIVKMKNFSAA